MKIKRLFVIFLLLLHSTPALAEHPSHNGKVVLFGNLHAHSQLSDDVSSNSNDMMPIEAFKYAHAHGLDFLAITDHHKADDAPGRKFQLSATEYTDSLFKVAQNYNQNNAGQFVAIPGFEWGTTKTGNHVNVFGASSLPPDSIKDKDYDTLYDWAVYHADFVQLNHPYSWNNARSKRNKNVGNFGAALYQGDPEFATALNRIVKTASIITTVEKGHLSGRYKHSETKTHRDLHQKAYTIYKRLLNKGLRLSPAANQDTHWKNWGTVTAARTAVWADSVSYKDLMEGL